jgi:hypothetical protein
MGHYRFYELNPSDHITAGYSVECGSDAEAARSKSVRAARGRGVDEQPLRRPAWPDDRPRCAPFEVTADGEAHLVDLFQPALE